MNDKYISLSERFAAERKRLQLSQAEVAKAINKTREMVGRYERGASTPSGDALAELSNIGMDIYYVLVGRKVGEPSPVLLKPDELALLDIYRSLQEEDKSDIANFATGVAERALRNGISKTVRKKPGLDEEPENESPTM